MSKPDLEQIARFADMLGALGAEPRLRIMRLLLSAHPDGLVVGEIRDESTSRLDAVASSRQAEERRTGSGTAGEHFSALHRQHRSAEENIAFLYAECCTRNKAIEPKAIAGACCVRSQ